MASISSTFARRSILRAVGTAPALRSSAPCLLLAQKRFASSSTSTPSQTDGLTMRENLALLNSQREKRPLSPFISIYQPQLTWVPSIAHRMTGIALSGALYLSAIAYLTHPYFPALDSAHLIQLVHDTPTWLKGSIKFLFAAPFTFHSFNGIRHLCWDMGVGLSLKGVYTGIYTVIGLTTVSSIYLAFFV